jgi:hypothetical protein
MVRRRLAGNTLGTRYLRAWIQQTKQIHVLPKRIHLIIRSPPNNTSMFHGKQGDQCSLLVIQTAWPLRRSSLAYTMQDNSVNS